jgi:hypothetical protein
VVEGEQATGSQSQEVIIEDFLNKEGHIQGATKLVSLLLEPGASVDSRE